jgi:thiol-disulfide isomerase/thioredoxin
MHFVGVAFGFAFRVSGKRIRLLVVAPLLVLTAVGYVYGLGYFQNKLSFDTWTGKVEQAVLLSPMVFDTPDGGRKSLNDFKGNYLVLDFWSTTCGVCYKAFPDVQKLYDKYKDNSGVEILAVHCRYDRDDDTIDTGSKILLERGYTFPCLSMNVEDPVLIEVGVQVFPTLLIFDPDGKLVFRGNIGDAGKYMDEYLK